MPWPWPHHVERFRDIFGPGRDVDTDFVSAAKKREKNGGRLRDRNVSLRNRFDPRCVETPPGEHSPAKKQQAVIRVKATL